MNIIHINHIKIEMFIKNIDDKACMKRRLIQQGGGAGYTIYLPKKWVDERGLKPGAEIDVDEIGSNIVIGSPTHKIKELTLQFTKKNRVYFHHWIIHAYRIGYDKITVTSRDASILKKVANEFTPRLMGFEVTHQDLNSVVLENVSEPSDERFDMMLRRIFLTIKEMGEQVLIQNDISPLDLRADRLISFCKRSLTKKFVSPKNHLVVWELVSYLRLISRAYTHLSTSISKKKPSAEVTAYITKVNNLFNTIYDAYYKKDITLLNHVQAQRELLGFTLPNKLGKHHDTQIVARVQMLARLIQICSGAVFSAIVDEAKPIPHRARNEPQDSDNS